MPDCRDCRFGVYQEVGYSNYTVEGTDFHCAKKLHPEDGFDRWYGEDDRLKYGENCLGRLPGEPLVLPVEMHEVMASDFTDPNERQTFEMYMTNGA